MNILFAQQYNIVPNYNFTLADPGGVPPCKLKGADEPSKFTDNILFWEDAQRHTFSSFDHTTPDWFDTDLCEYWFWPTESPSKRFASIIRFNEEQAEGIRVILPAPLRTNKQYTLRLKVARSHQQPLLPEVKIRVHLTKFSEHWNANPSTSGNEAFFDNGSLKI